MTSAKRAQRAPPPETSALWSITHCESGRGCATCPASSCCPQTLARRPAPTEAPAPTTTAALEPAHG